MKVLIIIGSTRPTRIGSEISNWVLAHMPETADVDYSIVDLAEVNLPLLNEPIMPAMRQYKYDYTKAWSQRIEEADGYIFVTPEYNAGYSAPLKNAIDYLKQEWVGKPVMIVSYGVAGGGSASAQLRQVVERIGMRPTKTSPALSVTPDKSDDKGHFEQIDTLFKEYEPALSTAAGELTVALHEGPSLAA